MPENDNARLMHRATQLFDDFQSTKDAKLAKMETPICTSESQQGKTERERKTCALYNDLSSSINDMEVSVVHKKPKPPRHIMTYWPTDRKTPDWARVEHRCMVSWTDKNTEWPLYLCDYKNDTSHAVAVPPEYETDWLLLGALYEKGGVWLDPRIVCLKQMSDAFDLKTAYLQGVYIQVQAHAHDAPSHIALDRHALYAPVHDVFVAAWILEFVSALAAPTVYEKSHSNFSLKKPDLWTLSFLVTCNKDDMKRPVEATCHSIPVVVPTELKANYEKPLVFLSQASIDFIEEKEEGIYNAFARGATPSIKDNRKLKCAQFSPVLEALSLCRGDKEKPNAKYRMWPDHPGPVALEKLLQQQLLQQHFPDSWLEGMSEHQTKPMETPRGSIRNLESWTAAVTQDATNTTRSSSHPPKQRVVPGLKLANLHVMPPTTPRQSEGLQMNLNLEDEDRDISAKAIMAHVLTNLNERKDAWPAELKNAANTNYRKEIQKEIHGAVQNEATKKIARHLGAVNKRMQQTYALRHWFRTMAAEPAPVAVGKEASSLARREKAAQRAVAVAQEKAAQEKAAQEKAAQAAVAQEKAAQAVAVAQEKAAQVKAAAVPAGAVPAAEEKAAEEKAAQAVAVAVAQEQAAQAVAVAVEKVVQEKAAQEKAAQAVAVAQEKAAAVPAGAVPAAEEKAAEEKAATVPAAEEPKKAAEQKGQDAGRAKGAAKGAAKEKGTAREAAWKMLTSHPWLTAGTVGAAGLSTAYLLSRKSRDNQHQRKRSRSSRR